MSVREIDPEVLGAGVAPEATEPTAGDNKHDAGRAAWAEFTGSSYGTETAMLPIIMNTNEAANDTRSETSPAVVNHMEIANTILAQINASDFWARARWGVKQMIALGGVGQIPGLMMNCTRGNKIIVKLDSSDTYTVEIYRGGKRRTWDTKPAESVDMIHAEALVASIDSAFSKVFGRD